MSPVEGNENNMNRYKDVIGAALAYPGGYPVFGAEDLAGAQQQALQQQAMQQHAAQQQALSLGMSWPGWCGAPGAGFDPNFRNRWLKSIAVGPVCGPTEVEMLLGSDFPTDGVVAKGAIVTVRFVPQIPLFKAWAIGVGSDVASSFTLISLQGANQNLLAGSGNIPCMALIETARYKNLNGASVVGNQPIIGQFINTSSQDMNFGAWIAGVGVSAGGVGIFGGPEHG